MTAPVDQVSGERIAPALAAFSRTFHHAYAATDLTEALLPRPQHAIRDDPPHFFRRPLARPHQPGCRQAARVVLRVLAAHGHVRHDSGDGAHANRLAATGSRPDPPDLRVMRFDPSTKSSGRCLLRPRPELTDLEPAAFPGKAEVPRSDLDAEGRGTAIQNGYRIVTGLQRLQQQIHR